MKKRYTVLLCSTLMVSTLYAKNTPIAFEKTYGSKNNDSAHVVMATDDGYLISGTTEYDRDKRSDMYLFKIDKLGNKIWSKAIGGDEDDEGNALIQTKDGYLVVGTTKSFGGERSSIYVVDVTKEGEVRWQKAFFSSDDSYYTGTGIAKMDKGYKIAGWENKLEFFGGEVNGYVIDIDATGERTKLRRYGGEDDDAIYDILKIKDGYLLAGESESLNDDNDFNAYVVRIDNNGTMLWQHGYGWGYDEKATSIVKAKDGYILTGITKSNRDKREEVYVVKIDQNGKIIWQNTYGGKYREEAYDMVADDDGYVIVGVTETNTNGRSDMYALKIDENGKILWDKNFGGKGDDIAYSVCKSDDGYLIVGETESFDSRRKDAYVVKIDKNGNLKK